MLTRAAMHILFTIAKLQIKYVYNKASSLGCQQEPVCMRCQYAEHHVGGILHQRHETLQ